MIHGIMGSFMLNGVGSSAGKLLAWIGVGILVVHTVIGVILTVQSLGFYDLLLYWYHFFHFDAEKFFLSAEIIIS